MIKIFIVDDHPVVIEGLKSVFDDEKNGIKVIGWAYSANEALEKLQKVSADVVLLDLLMPEMSGVEFCPILKNHFPELKVIALTGETDTAILFNAWNNKMDAILMKYCGKQELIDTIHSVLEDRRLIGQKVPDFFMHIESSSNVNRPRLTKREQQVLNILAKGYERKEVGEILDITKNAVDFHCKSLYKKFNKNKLMAVVEEARRLRYIS
jgi:DNA-binding NarL/FixJ family response regulator